MISPTKSPKPTPLRRYRALLMPPLVRSGKLARLMVDYQRATPQERPVLEAEFDRLLPPAPKTPAA
jgi:hypothetical protein